MADKPKHDPLDAELLRMTERPSNITDDDELVLRTCTAMLSGAFDMVPDALKPSAAVSLLCNMCGACADPEGFWQMVTTTMAHSMKLIVAMREGQKETKQ